MKFVNFLLLLSLVLVLLDSVDRIDYKCESIALIDKRTTFLHIDNYFPIDLRIKNGKIYWLEQNFEKEGEIINNNENTLILFSEDSFFQFEKLDNNLLLLGKFQKIVGIFEDCVGGWWSKEKITRAKFKIECKKQKTIFIK